MENRARSRDERSARGLWALLLIVVSLLACMRTGDTVCTQYSRAAGRWLSGAPLFNKGGSGFIYLPQAAILHIPFALLPHVLDEILWRTVTIGMFALGLRRLCALSERSGRGRPFFLATVVAVPLSFSAAQNGQATLLVAGMVLLAIGDVVDARWTRSTALLCLAFAFKPVVLPFVLLLGALYSPMRWRLMDRPPDATRLAHAAHGDCFPFRRDPALLSGSSTSRGERLHPVSRFREGDGPIASGGISFVRRGGWMRGEQLTHVAERNSFPPPK